MEEARAYAINLGFDFETYQNFNTFFDRTKQKGNVKKFADKIGKSTTTIYSRIYLLSLPEPIQDAIEAEEQSFPLMYANEITKLRKIGARDLVHRFMMNIFDEYKAKHTHGYSGKNGKLIKILDSFIKN